VKIEAGTNHDEVKWMDVAVHACQILNASTRVIFVTASDLVLQKAAVDHAQADGLKVITVPENIKYSLRGILDLKGNPVRDLSVYQTEWEKSFEFKFVKPANLNSTEREIFGRTQEIAELVGGLPKKVREIKVSETMRPDFLSGNTTKGLWDPESASIIILRAELKALRAFAGTLLHEIAHARSGFDDVTRNFENELTDMLGVVAALNLD